MKALLVGTIWLVAVSASCAADRYALYDDHGTAGMTKVTGREYMNNNYGFAVQVPDGQVAWMSTAPSPNHGVRIFLGPRRSIEVDASLDYAFLGSASAVAEDGVSALPWEKSSKSEAKPGGASAARVVVQGPGERRRVVLASWGEVEKDDDINYEVSLETTKSDFDRDEKVFNRIVRSFRYLGRSPRVGAGGRGASGRTGDRQRSDPAADEGYSHLEMNTMRFA